MDLDIKSLISKAVEAFTKDESAKKNFESNPIKAIESVLGVDLPDETITKVVDGVKAALAGQNVTEQASGLLNKVKGLFGK